LNSKPTTGLGWVSAEALAIEFGFSIDERNILLGPDDEVGQFLAIHSTEHSA